MQESSEHANISILYVEDDESVRKAVTRLIRKRYPGFTITSAGNGKEGLETFKMINPDIVITDICMPEMDGLQMAKKIGEIAAGARIIVTSANHDEEKSIDSVRIEGISFVGKPVIAGKLFAAIESHVKHLTFASAPVSYPISEMERK